MSFTPVLHAEGLTKWYGGILALDQMHISLAPGSIHAVVGENGAGKSTLMKILAGIVPADGGTIQLDGRSVDIRTPNDAKRFGISIFHQELSVFPHRSVLANLYANREPRRFGIVSRDAMVEQSREVLDQLGLTVDVDKPVGELNLGERQLVELCRVLIQKPRVLILDEPNSALNQQETERLFGNLLTLRDSGVSMLYVSHRLREVFQIADTITVCRNGKHIITSEIEKTDTSQVVQAMIGGTPQDMFPPKLDRSAPTDDRAIQLAGYSYDGAGPIDLSVESGRIVGLAGLDGSGAKELLYSLFGFGRPEGRYVELHDSKGVPASPTEAARRGICLVPADRKRSGLMMIKSLVWNMAHVSVGAMRTGSFVLRKEQMGQAAERQISSLRIKAGSPNSRADELSGGNQQKVVVGKWLEVDPALVLLDDPTRGVDVGAKREIYELIQRLAVQGRTVLFFSTELFELIGICDRVLCFFDGHIVADIATADTDEWDILHLINTGRKRSVQ